MGVLCLWISSTLYATWSAFKILRKSRFTAPHWNWTELAAEQFAVLSSLARTMTTVHIITTDLNSTSCDIVQNCELPFMVQLSSVEVNSYHSMHVFRTANRCCEVKWTELTTSNIQQKCWQYQCQCQFSTSIAVLRQCWKSIASNGIVMHYWHQIGGLKGETPLPSGDSWWMEKGWGQATD